MNFGWHHQRGTARPSTEGREVLWRVGLRGVSSLARGQCAALELQAKTGVTGNTKNKPMTNTWVRP